MAIITPNQIGSRPIDKSTGPIKGTTIKVISIKSRINPRRNISSITIMVADMTPPGRPISKPSISSSPPKPRKIDENMVAPTKMS